MVLISSASARVGREDRPEGCAWLAARRRARTLSASWSSRELEWLFFSVTPISGSTSRIDLLLTSSSLARSLIRILLIRPFALRTVPLSLHINLTASVFRFAQLFRKRARIALTASPRKEQAPPRIQLFLPAHQFLRSAAPICGFRPPSGAASTSAVISSAPAACLFRHRLGRGFTFHCRSPPRWLPDWRNSY